MCSRSEGAVAATSTAGEAGGTLILERRGGDGKG